MLRSLTFPDIFFLSGFGIRSLRIEFPGALNVCIKGGVGLGIFTTEGLESGAVGGRSLPRGLPTLFLHANTSLLLESSLH